MTRRITSLLLAAALCGGCAIETQPADHVASSGGAAGTATYVLTTVDAPLPDDTNHLAGFDLDAHDTLSPTDPIGCGKADFENGVDNEGALLLHDVVSYLPWFDAAAFRTRINDGSLLFLVSLANVDN